jgi:hypothetical protein
MPERGVASGVRVLLLVGAACAAALSFQQPAVEAHGTEARFVQLLQWRKEHIARVFGVQASLGARAGRAAVEYNALQMQVIDKHMCVVGGVLAFDVDNAYAFDVDEDVQLDVTYAPALSGPFVVAWDQNGGTGSGTIDVTPEAGEGVKTVSLTLNRARFAGQGVQGTDFAIGSNAGVALCDVKIARSGTTRVPTAFGEVRLTVRDKATREIGPARLGIYDNTGRAPLASDDALMLQRFADDLRMLPVNPRTTWPSDNRQAFYVDGRYATRLPVGTYELVATRGHEYRSFKSTFEVKLGQTVDLTIDLERYADMPSAGWYSGDAHIHLTRDEVEDPLVWGMSAAEDVHVGNVLEMGNILTTHFRQPKAWGVDSRYSANRRHYIVSGLEGPRTGQMGHTIHHNIPELIHANPEKYFMYTEAFQRSQDIGGISGFAHAGVGFNGTRGMALTTPFGLVDFIEVLQGGRVQSDSWYRFLDMGYRVSPAAGSDWPYTDFPGVVRNYVKLDGPLDLDKWFDAFEAGRTYVTNGPLIEFTINGRTMGEELRVKRGTALTIEASARLNPDIDKLSRLELVVLSDVAATAPASGDRAQLRHQIRADHGMWVAVRALGEREAPAPVPGQPQRANSGTIIAHSAPIYIVVDGEPSWNLKRLPDLVRFQKDKLQELLTTPIDPPEDLEVWETRDLLLREWARQKPLLEPVVAEAMKLYDELLARSRPFLARYPTDSN